MLGGVRRGELKGEKEIPRIRDCGNEKKAVLLQSILEKLVSRDGKGCQW